MTWSNLIDQTKLNMINSDVQLQTVQALLLVGSALASNSKEHSSGSPPQAAWTTSGATTQGKAKIRRFQNLECIRYDIYHHIIILYIYKI